MRCLVDAVNSKVISSSMCCSFGTRCRLLDVAAAGKKRAWPEELLHNRLLTELKTMPQVWGMRIQCLALKFAAAGLPETLPGT